MRTRNSRPEGGNGHRKARRRTRRRTIATTAHPRSRSNTFAKELAMTWSSALKRTAFLTTAGALVETTRRALRRALIRRRRIRAMRRSKVVFTRMGLAAAATGLAFLIRGVSIR